MLCRRTATLAVVILCLSLHGSKGRKRNFKRDNEESSFSISPSFSYQYHTNDHGDFDLNGGADSQPKLPNALSNNSNDNSGAIILPSRNEPDSIAQADASPSVNYVQPANPQYPQTAAQSRDSYVVPNQGNLYNPPPMNTYAAPEADYGYAPNPAPSEGYYAPNPIPSDGYYAPGPAPSESYGYPPAPAPVPSESYGYPQSKGYGYVYGGPGGGGGGGKGGGGGGGGGGFGDGGLPPPPALKGSIDYVLIPLILIGIAGPIFVVLYVVLGAFEAKLSPIVGRKSQSWNDVFTDSFRSLQPATELLFSSIDKALDHYECVDQAICRMGSFCHEMGLEKLGYLEPFVGTFGLGKKYQRQVDLLFATLRKPKSCFSIECPKARTKEGRRSMQKTKKKNE